MSGPVTRKRARLSSDEGHALARDNSAQSSRELSAPASASSRSRDEDFWYSDGNIIIVARDVEFRVYKGLLADHSAVFKDMLTFPQPPASTSSGAGSAEDPCPVVHVSDSPEDFRHILRFYMPRNDSNPFLSGEPSFDMISAAIRLGQKYQTSNLFEHAIGYLKTYYTTQYDVWVAQTLTVPPGFDDAAHSIGVVNLARLAAIIRGFEREDGTREQLAMDDIGLCFSAKGRLVQESVRITLNVFQRVISKKCVTTAECKPAVRKMHNELKDYVFDYASVDPFPARHGMFKNIQVCQYCKAMLEARDLDQRRAAWARLPEILGIGPLAGWPSE